MSDSATTAAARHGYGSNYIEQHATARSRRQNRRLAVLDWGLVETLLALGITPVGVSEINAYNDSVITPRVPAHVPDVGLRLAPSLELLQQLAPDLIFINSSRESQREMLERIAPVRAYAVYTDAGAIVEEVRPVQVHLAASGASSTC